MPMEVRQHVVMPAVQVERVLSLQVALKVADLGATCEGKEV